MFNEETLLNSYMERFIDEDSVCDHYVEEDEVEGPCTV